MLVALPAHSPLAAAPLHYVHSTPLPEGTLVRVPLGQRRVLGVVWDAQPEAARPPATVQPKPILETLTALPPLDAAWRQLIAFTARYYQRSLGEVALAALPPQLRELDVAQLARRLKTSAKRAAKAQDEAAQPTPPPGLREIYSPDYYAAFVRDPDGNRLEAVTRQPENPGPEKLGPGE